MQYGLRDWARRQPERPALEFDDGSVSYAELEGLTNRYAQLFRHHGLSRGDHIAAILGNTADPLALAWAAYRCGLYYTPVANTFSAPEIAYIVDNCDARLVLADARYAGTVAPLAAVPSPGRQHYAIGDIPGFTSLEPVLAGMPATPVADETPGALMMYSSGTTGAPKGIWRPLWSREDAGDGPPVFARDLIQIFGLSSDLRYLSPAPLYHAAPLRWSLAVTAAGGTAVIMRKFDAEHALHLIETRSITMSQWVPTMFRRLLDLPAGRREAFHAPWHRTAIHAAAPCSPELKRAMINWWGPILVEYYSGSESVGLTCLDTAEWLRKPGSVGRAVKGVLHILDEDDQELPPGRTGRVFFSGISAFQYYKDPAKTAGQTSRQGFQTLGEIGRVDEDGYLFLADRQGDLIISGGVNIYPQELEYAIEELPLVAECAVAAKPHADYGETPVAFVVPSRDGTDETALVETIADFCRTRLGRTKQPREIRVVDRLPRSDVGKLLRRVLRDQLRAEAEGGS
ncbi:AMP-binding protein [uncultured Tistrella sp.]|uniref:AMP-binding protein n=1 Tax=Tistrella mobilis TaxID=171437 RepID=UPI00262B9828|nr:AMP-binding protein [uncultured Tistrella sp.]